MLYLVLKHHNMKARVNNIIAAIACLMLLSCGSDAQNKPKSSNNQSTNAEKQKMEARTAELEARKKGNPERFAKYLEKMQGTWTFQQVQKCTKVSKDKFGLDSINGGSGAGVKAKLIITGSTYKFYVVEYGAKKTGEVVIQDENTYQLKTLNEGKLPELGTGTPFCQGKVDLAPSNLYEENNTNLATILLYTFGNSSCSLTGGSGTLAQGSLYWDDKAGTIHWSYLKQSQCQFEGNFNGTK